MRRRTGVGTSAKLRIQSSSRRGARRRDRLAVVVLAARAMPSADADAEPDHRGAGRDVRRRREVARTAGAIIADPDRFGLGRTARRQQAAPRKRNRDFASGATRYRSPAATRSCRRRLDPRAVDLDRAAGAGVDHHDEQELLRAGAPRDVRDARGRADAVRRQALGAGAGGEPRGHRSRRRSSAAAHRRGPGSAHPRARRRG